MVEFLFLATVFTVSFAKLQWEVAGTLSLSDVLTGIFLIAWLGTRVGTGDRRIAWGAAVAGLFFLGFLAVYLIGFFNLETEQALAQWAKGMFKFLLHFLFLVVGLAYLARRSERFYWTTFAVFIAGFVANAVYGIVQLGTAEVLGSTSTSRCSRRSPAVPARSTSTARSRGRASSGRTRSRATRTTSESSS